MVLIVFLLDFLVIFYFHPYLRAFWRLFLIFLGLLKQILEMGGSFPGDF